MEWIKKITYEENLLELRKKRSDKYVYESINKLLTDEYINNGWELHKEHKRSNKMKRLKPIDEQFEDEVWSLFASMGFKALNNDRNLKIPYNSNNPSLTKQIDVMAMDDETILIVECKCATSGKRGNFKDDLEAIQGYKSKIFSEIRNAFPDKPNRKARYILATKNYEIGEQDRERMKEFQIQHFDSKTIEYYVDLAKHLGAASRFQLLGQLFEGQKIGEMDNKIPAVRGKMGGQVYYSFSIAPEKLLKIAYVLHRTDANHADADMRPTYQRVIKKNRLNEIQNFIDGGGYFPNSIVISIDTRRKELKFDYAPLSGDSSDTKIGILHLPQLYKTAYIIDGQHRLYGYSDSKYAENNTIPVVAFENLDKEEQVKLFIEINEKQKAVPKRLQNTLFADLLWNDDDWNKRRKALRSRLAMDLGEKPASPLYERIEIGENEKTQNRNITLQTIENGLSSSNFLSKYGKNNVIISNGTFDRGDNEATLKALYKFLELSFNYFKTNLSVEWDKGDSEHGILTINNTIFAIIRILNDIVNLLNEKKEVDSITDSPEEVFEEAKHYIDPLIRYIQIIDDEDRNKIKKARGATTLVWRMYQKAIAEARKDFKPDGLEEWIEDNSRKFNEEAMRMLRDVELHLKKDFNERLSNHYGGNWQIDGIPKKVYDKAIKLAADKDYEGKLQRGTTDFWDCLYTVDYRDIAISGSNWREMT